MQTRKASIRRNRGSRCRNCDTPSRWARSLARHHAQQRDRGGGGGQDDDVRLPPQLGSGDGHLHQVHREVEHPHEQTQQDRALQRAAELGQYAPRHQRHRSLPRRDRQGRDGVADEGEDQSRPRGDIAEQPGVQPGDHESGHGGAHGRPDGVVDHDFHPVSGIGCHGASLSRCPQSAPGRDEAPALGKGTAALVVLQDDLARRNSGLRHAAALVRQLVPSRTGPAPGSLDSIRLFIAAASAPASGQSYGTVPAALRAPLGRAEEALSRVASALAAELALLERGGDRPGDARRIRTLDSLTQIADERMLVAGVQARRDLLDRQQALQLAAGEVLRDAILWLALGAVGVVPAVYLVRRRVWRPLAELEAGLARVAEGDLTTGVPVRGSDELGRLAQHFNEMTRVLRDRAEEQGRFAAAGELLAGVAHEVNNPLMAIAAHAENSIADPVLPEPQRAEMLQILRQARRAAKLLRGLLRFVRVTEREVTRVNLNDVVRGAMDLVSYRFALDEIVVGGRLDPALVAALGDAIKLEQVIVNLLSNAIDALRAIKPPRELTVDTWCEGARVSVAVEDNARGVAAEMVPRLFRPFATTKARRGTGLGLYISRQIARAAGGDLALESRPGKGARFVLSLPAAAALPVASPAPPAPPAPSAVRPGAVPHPVASLAGLAGPVR